LESIKENSRKDLSLMLRQTCMQVSDLKQLLSVEWNNKWLGRENSKPVIVQLLSSLKFRRENKKFDEMLSVTNILRFQRKEIGTQCIHTDFNEKKIGNFIFEINGVKKIIYAENLSQLKAQLRRFRKCNLVQNENIVSESKSIPDIPNHVVIGAKRDSKYANDVMTEEIDDEKLHIE
jgi:hypothetical protein